MRAGRARRLTVQDLITRAQRSNAALAKHQNAIDVREDAGSMRHNNHGGPARTCGIDCLSQRCFPFGVEMRVWLVEHQKARPAEECACERDPLRLTQRQTRSAEPHRVFVGVRQPHDHVVRTNCSCGRDGGIVERGRIRWVVWRKAADVFSNRTGEKMNFLWDITDMLAERIGVPIRQTYPINTNCPLRRREDADSRFSVLFPFRQPERLTVHGIAQPEYREWLGRSLADLAKARGGHVSDALADWLLETDFTPTFALAIANTDVAGVGKLMANPLSCISGSDAGAHLQMFCGAGDSTLLLARHVRERGDLSLEAAVHALTGRQAQMLGLRGHGVLAPGMAADAVVFALDELTYGEDRLVNDLPGGLPRLTRDPGGYRYTIVNGEIVQAGGKATGALPARWLARAA